MELRSLLEGLDVNTLFGHIEGNPEDVFVDPLESKDYSIQVLTQKGEKKILQGTYDKKVCRMIGQSLSTQCLSS